MKNKFFMKKNWKWIFGIIAGVILIACLFFVFGEKDNKTAETDDATKMQVESIEVAQEVEQDTPHANSEKKIVEDIILEEAEAAESIANSQTAKTGSKENSSESENIKAYNTKDEEKEKIELSASKESVATSVEAGIEYVPIAVGWKVEDSAKGDITVSQKADLDKLISSWKSGEVSDTELKTKIMDYLDGQGIEYMEVSVTSKGYALYDEIPEIDLRDGGNLYSYVGTYSTGEQNPDGTEKTVCYNWSAFIF